MVFWHNHKYENLEKNVKGDILRGLMPKSFPLFIKKVTFKDQHLDSWDISVYCISIQPDKKPTQVKAAIQLKASTQVSLQNLNKMGISYERLTALEILNWNLLEENTTVSSIIELEKLNEKADNLLKTFTHELNKKYNLQFKSNILVRKIHQSTISNFSNDV